MNKGYFHIYTGDGKGKTTAALGLALRAAGAGLRVLFAQFVKGQRYSEIAALERFDDLITVRQFGRDCFIRNRPEKQDVDEAARGLQSVGEQVQTGRYDVVILDEACIALYYHLFSVEELLRVIDARPDTCELVVTGRYAPEQLVDAADLVTEMKEIRHYYAKGVPARDGIEK
ncbi:MAG: cob(I)yrinic acid a,c-diamide adenosyltransferase [Chitinivibrionales bacterium]|nr:cob(I)yrinic acid a,c-diamide adenosyltransferase [Chitinivibrionales bacterium]